LCTGAGAGLCTGAGAGLCTGAGAGLCTGAGAVPSPCALAAAAVTDSTKQSASKIAIVFLICFNYLTNSISYIINCI